MCFLLHSQHTVLPMANICTHDLLHQARDHFSKHQSSLSSLQQGTSRFPSPPQVTTTPGKKPLGATRCKIVTWRTGLKIRPLRGLGVGNIIYTISLIQKYMVTQVLLCGLGSLVSEGHFLFPQGPNSDNTSLYIHYTRLQWTTRLQADLHT